VWQISTLSPVWPLFARLLPQCAGQMDGDGSFSLRVYAFKIVGGGVMEFSFWKFEFVSHDGGWFIAWNDVIKLEWHSR